MVRIVLFIIILFLPAFSNAGVYNSVRTPKVAVGGGTGNILVERQGENTVDRIASAPYAETWVDSGTHNYNNTNLVTNIAAGSHSVRSTDIIGLVESAGTCTYAVGGSECTVSSFNLTPSCDLTSCSVTTTVSADTVTKVAFRYEGVGHYEGFGASTIGGRDSPIYHVTRCDDPNITTPPAGTLRAAVTNAGNRYVVFDVTCDPLVVTKSTVTPIIILHANVTIDGYTSPGGITIDNGLFVMDSWGYGGVTHGDAHDIIIRNIRMTKSPSGNNTVGEPEGLKVHRSFTAWSDETTIEPYNVVIDHVTVSDWTDDQIDIGCAHDITVSWSILRDPTFYLQNMTNSCDIGGHGTYDNHLTSHHNFFAPQSWRQPLMVWRDVSDNSSYDTSTTWDNVNNLIHVNDYPTSLMTSCERGAVCRIAKNYFLGSDYLIGSDIDDTHYWIEICTAGGNSEFTGSRQCGGAYTSGGGGYLSNEGTALGGVELIDNVMLNPYGTNNSTLNVVSGSYSPYADVLPIANSGITETDAHTAACRILAEAGVWPRNAGDLTRINAAKSDLETYDSVCP